ncbi:MAG: hypothetical protein NTAFB01_11420 [Nitrospira sp.]
MTDLVKAATSLSALELLTSKYLLEEEASGKISRSDAAWFQALRASYAFEKKKWRHSEKELSLMAVPGLVTVPAQYEAPSGEDVRLAVLRAYEANGNSLIDAYQTSPQTHDLPSLPGVSIPMGRLRLEGVKIEECASRPVGFACVYTVNLSVENSVASQHATVEYMDDFALTTRGWQSQSAIDRISEQKSLLTNRPLA